MYTIMTYFVNPSEREKIPPMITDSNQVRLAKMAGRRGRSHYHGLKTNCLAHIFDGFEMDKSEFMRVGEVTNYFLSTFSIMSVSMSLAIGSGFQEGCRTMYLHSFA
jgi:hypothetical protein